MLSVIVAEVSAFMTPNLILCIGIFAGAFVAGFSGFGLAAAAGAFLLHAFDAKEAVPLMMVCSVIAQAAGMIWLRSTLTLRPAIPFVIGGFFGLPVAIFIAQNLDSQTFRRLFGVFLVTYSSWTLLRLAFGSSARTNIALIAPAQSHIPPATATTASALAFTPKNITAHAANTRKPRRAPCIVGFFAGIVGGMTAMPGVVVSVWADAKGLGKSQQRGFVQPFILTMQISALGLMFTTQDMITVQTFSMAGIALLPLLLGMSLGLFLYGRCNPAAFRVAVLVIISCSGTALVLP